MTSLKWLVLLVVLALGGAGIATYDDYRGRYPVTDNAYIDATVVRITSQVGGPVSKVLVSSQQRVAENDELIRIDDFPYQLALRRAEAGLSLAQRTVQEHQAALLTAQASVTEVQVRLDNAERHWLRLHNLKSAKILSEDALEAAEAEFNGAKADLTVVLAQRHQAQARMEKMGVVDSLVVQAEADIAQARWNLEHTVLRAPCDGVTEQLGVHIGETVQAQRPLFVLVCSDNYWVEANFKETELDRIRPGQQVEIEVDMYPDQLFTGVVESINPASGTAFSLLPPENATGNWVKVTQRVPVRIRVSHDDRDKPLLMGTSANVRIDTETAPAFTALANSQPAL
jgi:membrane fusion protein (multidrug efflux system)